MNVRGVSDASTFEPAKVEELVQERLKPAMADMRLALTQELQSTLLAREHKDWRQVVGKADDKNEFRTWLATQPAEFQTEINTTQDASAISDALTKFKASAKKTAISQRQSRIEAAVVVKGAGGTAAAPSDDDDFNDGFRNG